MAKKWSFLRGKVPTPDKKQEDLITSDEDKINMSTTINTQAIIKKETSTLPTKSKLSTSVYLNYFTQKHDEKLIDAWFKIYLP
jgi:hypothetical protein